jgi:spermidine synthase
MHLFIEKDAGPTNKQKVWTPRKILCSEKSDYQNITILDTDDFGEVLFLDSVIQSSESDEKTYHCHLVHPAMYMKSIIHTYYNDTHLWNILVLGGGEGCTMREALSGYRVDNVTQIDIDGDLVDLFSGPFAYWNSGAYSDPRAEVRIEDAVEWATSFKALREPVRDMVFIDLVEPADFGREKWNSIILGACMALHKNGVLAAYVGTMTLNECYNIEDTELWGDFCAVLKRSFSTSSWKPVHYHIYMPSWGGWCMFFAASRADSSVWNYNLNDYDFINYMHNNVMESMTDIPKLEPIF